MSGRYEVEIVGGCMGPSLPDYTRLIADPGCKIRPFDLCRVVLKKGGLHDRFMREAWTDVMGDATYPNSMAKIFLSRTKCGERDVLLLGQLQPPCVGVVAVDEIEALHRIVGCADGKADLCAGKDELEAFQLIAPFGLHGKTIAPIS